MLHHFDIIKNELLQRMHQELPQWLGYHNVAHTLDVIDQTERIAMAEKMRDTEDLFLLKTAALFHDSGFIYTYKNHEEQSCEIAIASLAQYGLNDRHLDTVCSIVMATKIPQLPSNKLEQIMSDADLDYLGRSDFYTHSDNLKAEFFHEGFVSTEKDWNQLQLAFLESHHYFTASEIALRLPAKNERIAEITAWLQQHRQQVTY